VTATSTQDTQHAGHDGERKRDGNAQRSGDGSGAVADGRRGE
jgi:hypothetical protein